MRWVVLVLVLGSAVGFWVLSREEPTNRAPGKEPGRPTIPIPDLAGEIKHSAYPPPIDLEKVDRDRDLHGIVVRAADGEPVPGADLRVRFFPRRALNLPSEFGRDRATDGPTTISAADGSFVLSLESDALGALEVRAEGYAPYVAAMCRAGGHIRIELAEPVSLALTVLDSGGSPVDGASVYMARHASHDPPCLAVRGKTDGAGRIVMRDLPPNVGVSLDVEHPAHGSKRWFRDFMLPESGERQEEVRLDAGRHLHGRVTDADTGSPIAGASVGTARYWSQYVTKTDDDGRYELLGWNFSEHVTMAVGAAGYGPEGAAIGASDEINFRLRPGFVVRGTVVASDGSPIVCERVTVSGRGYSFRRGQTIASSVLSIRSGTTGEDGVFEIGGLRLATQHSIIIAAAGYGRTVLEFLAPKRGAALEVDVGRITLPVARSIRGRVLRDGEPVTNHRIELMGANHDSARLLGGEPPHASITGRFVYGRTDDLGRFAFLGLAKGTYLVRLRQRGAPYVKKSIEVRDTDVEVLVEAPAGRPLEVQVVDDDGQPVGGVYVWLDMQEGHTGAETDAQGRVKLLLTSPPKSVHARPREPELVPLQVDLGGDERELKLVLERGLPIRGVVVTKAGQPQPTPIVEAQRDGKKLRSVTGNAKGEFTLYVPTGGPCRLKYIGEASAGGGHTSGSWAGILDGVVPGGEPVRLVVAHPNRTRSMTVRVVLPDGTPIEGADIVPFGKTDAKGERKLVGLPDRPMPLWVEWKTSEYARPKHQSVVAAGQTVTIRFRTANPITGRLLRDGQPVAKTRITVRVAHDWLASAVTDAQGQFRLLVAAADAGPFNLDVDEPGRPALQLTGIAAGAKNLTVRWKDLQAR